MLTGHPRPYCCGKLIPEPTGTYVLMDECSSLFSVSAIVYSPGQLSSNEIRQSSGTLMLNGPGRREVFRPI